MKALWNQEEGKVLLANLGSSNMKKEERENITKVEDFYRVKTYTKPDEMSVLPMDREISVPYMVAQSKVGGTWNDHNAPFLVQIAGCNMKCPYCFVPQKLKHNEGTYFSSDEVVQMRDDREPDRKTIRISGGEPFLVPEFISAMGKSLENRRDTFLWVDTNLLGKGYSDVINALDNYLIDDRFGICGCFKGFNEDLFEINSGISKKLYKMQWDNAVTIHDVMKYGVGNGNPPLFFYVPEMLLMHYEFSKERLEKIIGIFMDEIQSRIHENAPLRTTILQLNEYNANKGWVEALLESDEDLVRIESGTTRKAWNEELKKRFSNEQLWLPQYQSKL